MGDLELFTPQSNVKRVLYDTDVCVCVCVYLGRDSVRLWLNGRMVAM